jgi:hypothetical protein
VKTKPAKPRLKTRAKETLPIQPLLEELAVLRTNARELLACYRARLEGEIARLISLVGSGSDAKKVPHERVHDLRDMLILLRGVAIKPGKGRRRDLKKIENTLEELLRIAERW